jgi:hypothetical protein
LGIFGAVTAAVARTESSIAINVHVDKVAILALEVHDAVVVEMITAVSKVCSVLHEADGPCCRVGMDGLLFESPS